MSTGILDVLSCEGSDYDGIPGRPSQREEQEKCHPRCLSRGVINPRCEVKWHGYTPLLRDRLSFVKRQFVEATGRTRVVESRWVSSQFPCHWAKSLD